MYGFQARNKRILGVGLHGSLEDVEFYDRHNEHVRSVVPSERLLEFEPKDGWEPLCQFLGVPVPTDQAGNKLEYPHVNDTESIRRGLNFFIGLGYFVWNVLIGVILFAMKRFYLF